MWTTLATVHHGQLFGSTMGMADFHTLPASVPSSSQLACSFQSHASHNPSFQWAQQHNFQKHLQKHDRRMLLRASRAFLQPSSSTCQLCFQPFVLLIHLWHLWCAPVWCYVWVRLLQPALILFSVVSLKLFFFHLSALLSVCFVPDVFAAVAVVAVGACGTLLPSSPA